jgi:hypothetical protein
MGQKVCVISTAKDGAIVGLHPIDMRKPEGDDTPTEMKVVHLPGQSVHEIHILSELAGLAPDELVKRFPVKGGQLVEVEKQKSRPTRLQAFRLGRTDEEARILHP